VIVSPWAGTYRFGLSGDILVKLTSVKMRRERVWLCVVPVDVGGPLRRRRMRRRCWWRHRPSWWRRLQ